MALYDYYFLQEDASQRVRTEDDVIAYTWAHYLNQTDDPPRDYDVLLYMPMVKVSLNTLTY